LVAVDDEHRQRADCASKRNRTRDQRASVERHEGFVTTHAAAPPSGEDRNQ
jgi:hypothetical protein